LIVFVTYSCIEIRGKRQTLIIGNNNKNNNSHIHSYNSQALLESFALNNICGLKSCKFFAGLLGSKQHKYQQQGNRAMLKALTRIQIL